MDKLPFGLHENVGRKKKTNINGCPFSEIMDFANPLQTK